MSTIESLGHEHTPDCLSALTASVHKARQALLTESEGRRASRLKLWAEMASQNSGCDYFGADDVTDVAELLTFSGKWLPENLDTLDPNRRAAYIDQTAITISSRIPKALAVLSVSAL